MRRQDERGKFRVSDFGHRERGGRPGPRGSGRGGSNGGPRVATARTCVRVSGFEGFGSTVSGRRFRSSDSEFRQQGLGYGSRSSRVPDFGFRVSGWRFRVYPNSRVYLKYRVCNSGLRCRHQKAWRCATGRPLRTSLSYPPARL
jgi:hypothetical protein